MARVADDLKIWSRSTFGKCKQQLQIVNEVIFQLDKAQESISLSDAEFNLRKNLKLKVLGLAAIERARKRQASRISWLRAGDASTKLFHAKMRSCRWKNFIHALNVNNRVLVDHNEKEQAIFNHFSASLGQGERRNCTLNWEQLRIPVVTATELDGPFTMAEVWAAIVTSPAEKAPGPDGFTGQFFRSCWHIIKDDIMVVFQKFYHMAGKNFSDINTALIALLPKRIDASEIGHYRPISLIHSVAKLISKVLASRHSAALEGVISPAQTAFQRGKCIHDSFQFVQGCVRMLHREKKQALLFKLDFARAFDSVSWAYLIELLQQMGFSQRW